MKKQKGIVWLDVVYGISLYRADGDSDCRFGCFSEILRYDRNHPRLRAVLYYYHGALFPGSGFLNTLYFTLRSGGKTLITFLFDSVFSWVVALPLAFILCRFTALPILAIYAVVQAADIIKVVIGYILIRKGVWISNLVAES